jgi:Helicase conserved C-terminal domain
LSRIAPALDVDGPIMLSSAAKIASGFRSLFNMPETIAMLKGSGEDSYWRLTLRYALEGNIQAMLDEHLHVLLESLGLRSHDASRAVQEVSSHVQTTLSLRTAQVRVDELHLSNGEIKVSDFNTRTRFALRFADIRDDNDQAIVRADAVRDTFNSPFRPFILASTSIGQEGLDFHTWCHAVVHWNLPSNPVDLEQREGRVHRYKGHAVCKNIAERYGLAALRPWNGEGDPWLHLFSLAERDRQLGVSDLVPYWVFEEGRARVERRVPLLPFSREVGKFRTLKRGLALYRVVFGQPRQEDMLAHADRNAGLNENAVMDWLISLEPPTGDGVDNLDRERTTTGNMETRPMSS